jgi:type IV secretory pathway VirB10-like protein
MSIEDPHASKISPDDPRLRPRKRPRQIQRTPVLVGLAVVIVTVAGSVSVAMGPRDKRKREETVVLESKQRLPNEILDAPEVVPPKAESVVADAGPALREPAQPVLLDVPKSAIKRRGDSDRASARQRRIDDELRARGADVFVEARPLAGVPPDHLEEPDHALATAPATIDEADHAVRSLERAQQALVEFGAPAPAASRRGAAVSRNTGGYLRARVQHPRYPYEIKPGTIIPAVLQTAINSDLPGPVFAKVREVVYDSLRHEEVLIPQNATLIASYDSQIAWGQQRVILCWSRIVFPNGDELELDCMPGADLTGAAGLTGEVDEHWWRLAKGAALASLLSAGTAAAGGNTQGYNPTVPQQFARGAASEFGRAGEGITRRELMVQPTIVIAPGTSMNVLVTQTMPLEPYRAD